MVGGFFVSVVAGRITSRGWMVNELCIVSVRYQWNL